MTILKTARLTLAPPFMHEGMDVSHYLRWLCNERVVKYSEQRHYTHTTASQYEYLTHFNQPGGNLRFWEIQRNTIPIGSINAIIDPFNKTANVAIMIGEAGLWGSGYGPEAWEAVCNYLFETGIRKLEAGCMFSNDGMKRILNKTGFKLEAVIYNHFMRNGELEDKWCYGKYHKAKVIPFRAEDDAA